MEYRSLYFWHIPIRKTGSILNMSRGDLQERVLSLSTIYWRDHGISSDLMPNLFEPLYNDNRPDKFPITQL